MANFTSITSQVTNLLSSSSMITTADIQAIVQAEHTTILSDYPWSAKKVDAVITTVAPYSTGTVTTSGTALTGASTVFTSAMAGRYIRLSSGSYYLKISTYNSPTSLTLEAAPPSDVTAATYSIFQIRYSLPSDFDRIGSMADTTRLTEWTRGDIDRADPYRISTASYPDVYSIDGLDDSNNYQIEFWPVPSQATEIRYQYYKKNSLSAGTDIPLYRSDVLVWKSAESGAFFLHGRTGDAAWLALADRFHQRYTEALQGAREDDLGRSSTQSYVKDAYRFGGSGRGDDSWLDHDPLWLKRGG